MFKNWGNLKTNWYKHIIIHSEQSKCVVVTAMKALLKLVSHQESAKPTSLAIEFDLQLEKDGVCKSLSLYKERRFSKMGYTAGA